MKKFCFPLLFVVLLLGFWVFSKSPGAASSTTSSTVKPGTSAQRGEELTDKEEIFAANLSPQNQEIFTKWMTRKERTMAMEMIVENHRSGGSLSPDQVIEQLSKDFNLAAPSPQPAPPAGSTAPLPGTSSPPSKTPAPAPTPQAPSSSGSASSGSTSSSSSSAKGGN